MRNQVQAKSLSLLFMYCSDRSTIKPKMCKFIAFYMLKPSNLVVFCQPVFALYNNKHVLTAHDVSLHVQFKTNKKMSRNTENCHLITGCFNT